MTDWESLYRRMRNVAAGYSNFCEESGSTRRLEKEFTAIEADARALAGQQSERPAPVGQPRPFAEVVQHNQGRYFTCLAAPGVDQPAIGAKVYLAAPAGQAVGEPFAYWVYVRAEQRGEFVHDLDDAIDDLTNCECEVTPLYDLASQAERTAGREGS